MGEGTGGRAGSKLVMLAEVSKKPGSSAELPQSGLSSVHRTDLVRPAWVQPAGPPITRRLCWCFQLGVPPLPSLHLLLDKSYK